MVSAARARTRMCATRWQCHTARANSRANSGKREERLRGALTSTAHGAGLHHQAAGHGERAHDQEDNARHSAAKGKEAVSDPVLHRGGPTRVIGRRRTKNNEIDLKLTLNLCICTAWG